ncbi:unnamed protein product, partial [Diplocarpon coronariae]
MWGVSYW